MNAEILLDYQRIPAAERDLNLLLRIKAPDLPKENRRQPLRLITILDCSDSMSEHMVRGDRRSPVKFDQLKQTMHKLVENLTDQDELEIIWFSDDTWGSGFRRMDSSHKQETNREIDNARTVRGTNISRSIDDAIISLQVKGIKENDGVLTRVLFLTDGQATSGDTSTEGIVERVSKLHFVGLSCFGYGEDYNQDLLAAMSEKGGGGYYYIADPSVVSRAFATEIGGLLTCYGRNLSVSLDLPDGVRLDRILNDYQADEGVFSIGDVYFEEERTVVFRLKADATKAQEFRLSASVGFDAEGKRTEIPVHATLTTGELSEVNKTVAEEVAVLEAAIAQIEAKKMADAGNWQGARNLMQNHIEALNFVGGAYATAYCAVVGESLDNLNASYTATGAGAKGLSATASYALRAKRGIVGRSASASKLQKMATPGAMQQEVDKFLADKEDEETE